jgi:hypothetical protein
MGPILDAEMPEQVIWPAQVDWGGLAWTRHSPGKRMVVTATKYSNLGTHRVLSNRPHTCQAALFDREQGCAIGLHPAARSNR